MFHFWVSRLRLMQHSCWFPLLRQMYRISFILALAQCPPDLVRALVSHPVHRQVRLSLEARSDLSLREIKITAQEMNDALKAFQHPVHLNIPHILTTFSCEDEIFTANPVLQSLTINSNGVPVLSPKILEGIACNTSLTHLTIDATGWTDCH
jgi:hypothetical protein